MRGKERGNRKEDEKRKGQKDERDGTKHPSTLVIAFRA